MIISIKTKISKNFNKNKKVAKKQLLDLGFEVDGDLFYFDSKDFRARIIVLSDRPKFMSKIEKGKQIYYYDTEDQLVLHLADKKTFSRWANSVNFEIDLSEVNLDFMKLKNTVAQARKIVKSKAFNFNRYFHRIELDYF